MSNSKSPQILNQKPEPRPEMKTFHHKKLLGWSGFVNIGKIQGWAGNRRIDLYSKKCEAQFGRPPTNDEIYTFMLHEKDLYIKELARSILLNGIRVPIILDANGTLLDGNRRYVSTRHAIENNPDRADELSDMPAWVLSEDTDDEDKRKIVVECNFIEDWKVDWPSFIRSMTVYEDYSYNGLTYDKLFERYGIDKGKLHVMVRTMSLIQEFLNLYDNSDEAYEVTYLHYHWFEEALNKNRAKLDSDPEFKEQFFDWMMQGKFVRMKQVSNLSEIRDNEEAWAIIRSDSRDAVDAAIHIVQGEKLPSLVSGEKKIKRLVKQLQGLTEQEIASIGPGTLADLELTLLEIIAMSRAARQAKKGKSNESKHRETSG